MLQNEYLVAKNRLRFSRERASQSLPKNGQKLEEKLEKNIELRPVRPASGPGAEALDLELLVLLLPHREQAPVDLRTRIGSDAGGRRRRGPVG